MKIEYNPNSTHILVICAENEEDQLKIKEYCRQIIQQLRDLNEDC